MDGNDGDGRSEDRRERMVGNSDPRAMSSRRRLVSAYRDIVADRRDPNPAVRQVVERAGVTRSTFYAHFSSTSDLAVEALAEVFDVVASMDAAARSDEAASRAEVSESSLREVIGFIEEHSDTYRDLLGHPEGFARAVEDAFTQRSLATLRASGGSVVEPEITARFIAAGVMGVVAAWLRDDSDRSADDLAAALTRIIPADFTGPRPASGPITTTPVTPTPVTTTPSTTTPITANPSTTKE